MLDRPIFALDFRRRRAREGPLGGTGGVIMSIYGEPDLFRGRKIPAAPDREHEFFLNSIENPQPPLLIRRRKTRPLMVSIGRTPLPGIERWTPDE